MTCALREIRPGGRYAGASGGFCSRATGFVYSCAAASSYTLWQVPAPTLEVRAILLTSDL
jgi:hypothetical protein